MPKDLLSSVQSLHNELVMLSQIYLKLEWDRVKSESKGKLIPCCDDKYKTDVDINIKEYKLSLYDYSLAKLPDLIKKNTVTM